jgi:hypothetical protein
MAKFEKFDSKKQIAGLGEAALQIQAEELIRGGMMPDLGTVLRVVAKTREKYVPLVEAARRKR